MASDIRRGLASDVPALCALKSGWALTANARDPREPLRSGGFLLGCSPQRYRDYVDSGCVLVAAKGAAEELLAFSVVLPDAVLRASELFARRHLIEAPARLVAKVSTLRLAYFDQLAARSGHALTGARLGYLHLLSVAREHDAILATTVVRPRVNTAVVPYLERLGFQRIGTVTEHYDRVGEVTSAVHLAHTRELSQRRLRRDVQRFERRLSITAVVA